MSSFKIFAISLAFIIIVGGFVSLYGSEGGVDYNSDNIIIANETYDTPSFSFLQSLQSARDIETGNDFIDSMLFKFIGGLSILGLLYYLRSGN